MTKQKNTRPRIGILTSFQTFQESGRQAIEKFHLNRDYVDRIQSAGGVAFLLPVITDTEALLYHIESMDAILLPGGCDLHPRCYREEPSSWLEHFCRERDTYEITAIQYAHSLRKPILGICRGVQSINVAFGGTLYQDIEHHYPNNPLVHRLKGEDESHEVKITKETQLFQALGKEALLINSFHHQAVKDVAPGFSVNALAKDGVIEGIEKSDGSFVVGVQWHPERMGEHHPEMSQLFHTFIEKSRLKIG